MIGNRRGKLLKAAILVFVAVVAGLVIHGVIVAFSPDRDAALYEAVLRSDLPAVTELLREHAAPNTRAPVSISWALGRPSAVGFRGSVLRLAVEQAMMHSITADIADMHGRAAGSDQAIVIALLDAGAHADPHDGGQNLLELTLPSRLALATEALLKHGAPLPASLSGQPLLAGAVNWRNSAETIEALLHAGADVTGPAGRSALTQTYEQSAPGIKDPPEALAVFRTLLNAGADPNTPIHTSTMLYDAVRFRRPQIVRLLLQAHADPNRAPAGDKARKVELLLKHGANVNTLFGTTEYGRTTVRQAAHRGAKGYHIDLHILTLLDGAAQDAIHLR